MDAAPVIYFIQLPRSQFQVLYCLFVNHFHLCLHEGLFQLFVENVPFMAGETACPMCTQPSDLCGRSSRSSTKFRIKMLPMVFENYSVCRIFLKCQHIPCIRQHFSYMQLVCIVFTKIVFFVDNSL